MIDLDAIRERSRRTICGCSVCREHEADRRALLAEVDRLRAGYLELDAIAGSGESDIRAIGPVLDRILGRGLPQTSIHPEKA